VALVQEPVADVDDEHEEEKKHGQPDHDHHEGRTPFAGPPSTMTFAPNHEHPAK